MGSMSTLVLALVALVTGLVLVVLVAARMRLRKRQTDFRRQVGVARILESRDWPHF